MGGCLVVYLTTIQDSSKSRKFASEIERYNGTSNRIAKLQLGVICSWNTKKKRLFSVISSREDEDGIHRKGDAYNPIQKKTIDLEVSKSRNLCIYQCVEKRFAQPINCILIDTFNKYFSGHLKMSEHAKRRFWLRESI